MRAKQKITLWNLEKGCKDLYELQSYREAPLHLSIGYDSRKTEIEIIANAQTKRGIEQ